MKWHDLSSSEIVQRLVHRGCPYEVAVGIVSQRDHEVGSEVITDYLTNGVPEWVQTGETHG